MGHGAGVFKAQFFIEGQKVFAGAHEHALVFRGQQAEQVRKQARGVAFPARVLFRGNVFQFAAVLAAGDDGLGHGTAMGGVIVDGGNYNWANGKFPQIDGPSEGYHGLNFHEAFGAAAFIVKCRVDGVRDLGCCPSPFDSYLMTLGLETLSLRVRHEVESARRLAEYCRNHPKVERVSFVGFESHPSYANAKKYFRFGSSAVFTIELKGTLDSTVRFVESLNLAAHMVMIGDSVTVVTHPASTTHKQLSDADLAAAGVTPTMLRISVGLENTDDLIDDFEQAFAHIG